MDLTKALAIYAASLSTIVFIWNVRRSRPDFSVKLVFGADEIDGNFVSGVMIAIQNHSSHKIHISGVSFLYPYREVDAWERIKHLWRFKRFPHRIGWVYHSLRHMNLDTGLPISLEPGESHQILVSDIEIEHMLEKCTERKIIASVQDALWRNKYSAVFDYPKPKT